MKNYFEELHENGQEYVELSIRELQDLFIQGRITQTQFTSILMQNLGQKKFTEIFNETLEEYFSVLHDGGKN